MRRRNFESASVCRQIITFRVKIVQSVVSRKWNDEPSNLSVSYFRSSYFFIFVSFSNIANGFLGEKSALPLSECRENNVEQYETKKKVLNNVVSEKRNTFCIYARHILALIIESIITFASSIN